MIRVALADDQTIVRAGLRALLDTEDDITVVGEAEDGLAAVKLAHELRPDVMLMDIRMPGIDGITATRRVTSDSDVRVVVLTTFDLDEYVFEAIRAGASGFLVKHTRPEELIRALHVVAEGEALLSPGVTRRLIAEFVISAATVRTHVSRAMTKLHARDRAQLVVIAYQSGLIHI